MHLAQLDNMSNNVNEIKKYCYQNNLKYYVHGHIFFITFEKYHYYVNFIDNDVGYFINRFYISFTNKLKKYYDIFHKPHYYINKVMNFSKHNIKFKDIVKYVIELNVMPSINHDVQTIIFEYCVNINEKYHDKELTNIDLSKYMIYSMVFSKSLFNVFYHNNVVKEVFNIQNYDDHQANMYKTKIEKIIFQDEVNDLFKICYLRENNNKIMIEKLGLIINDYDIDIDIITTTY